MIAIVDCNNFYVSCERLFNPKLKGKPVVVLSNNDGCIISRSSEAKALGIRMGVPLYKAEELIRKNDVYVFSSNYSLYGNISKRVMKVLSTFTDEIEMYSIDEAFLQLKRKEINAVKDYGRNIKDRVEKWIGVPISVGIAKTKTLAKAANSIAKKNSNCNGVFCLTSQTEVEEILRKLDLKDIWGIGRGLESRIMRQGIINPFELTKLEDKRLIKNLTVVGLKTVKELRGEPCFGLYELPAQNKMIMCSRSFGKDVLNIEELNEAVSLYTARAAEKLREQNCMALQIQVFLLTKNYSKKELRYYNSASGKLSDYTSYAPDLIKKAQSLLEKIYKPGYKYYKAGVLLQEIISQKQLEKKLFSDEKILLRKESAMKGIDTLNRRLGRNTVYYASSGIKQEWKMKQLFKSKSYTTKWNEILTVKV